MSATKDGGPAFPHSLDWGWSDKLKRYEAIGFHGMTLRDWFAGQALVGLLSAYGHHAKRGNDGALMISHTVAAAAFDAADAMLAAREGGAR